jgi:peptide/nickel transport system permease protein
LGLIVLVISLSLAAPILAPYQPDAQFDNGLTDAGEPIGPSQTYLLGTDTVGRDLLSRMLYGGQTSLLVALVVNVIAITVGTIFGLASGYFGGFVDTVLSRVVDTMLAFPAILFAIALSSAIKPSVGVAILALSLISWTSIARVVRGQVLALKEREFILAARSVGVKNSRILIKHIIPHLFSPLIVLLALTIPTTILLEATLSYLGAGVPPNVPSWGNIIQDGTRYYRTAPWIVIFPGLAIFLTVFGFNLFGEGLRDALDPRQKQ